MNDPKNLQILRSVFTNPEALKPGQTPESITQKVAERFAELSDGMQKRGVEPFKAAHFLMKLICATSTIPTRAAGEQGELTGCRCAPPSTAGAVYRRI